ncbi:MAG: ACP S-malonyltransferase [Gemmatimonadaceae bacterium]|nr:ACP S-malonyltransferase [Gemmatimonadaceae bacterium]
MDVILLFPGQGSQKPGMGKDLADAFPEARAVFKEADDALGISLSTLCFEGPADELTETRNAQPALLVHGAAVWAMTKGALIGKVRAAAGHSLGEHTAYHAAGAIDLAGAVKLVRRRGELMNETGKARPGTMAAILGTPTRPVAEICEEATREAGLVVPANYNSDEQTVISGEIGGVEKAMELAKAAGAKRAIRLPVSGAFHSPLMEPAAAGFKEAVDEAPFSDPKFPIYSNVDAKPSRSASEAREMLFRQLTSPVLWSTVVRNLAKDNPDALYVEMGPGAVLTGLVPRLVPGAKAVSCGTPADVEKLLQMVA